MARPRTKSTGGRKKKSGGSVDFQKAARAVSFLEIYYAKILCSLSAKGRLKVYKKLASLLDNRFSLMDALERVHDIVTNNGKNPNEPMAIAVMAWSRQLQNGESFSNAPSGWAPARERVMLSVGGGSDMSSARLHLV